MIDRTETDVGDMPAHPLVDLIGRGMRVVAGNLVPHNFKLPGLSAGAFLHGTSYASRSSARDRLVSGASFASARARPAPLHHNVLVAW